MLLSQNESEWVKRPWALLMQCSMSQEESEWLLLCKAVQGCAQNDWTLRLCTEAVHWGCASMMSLMMSSIWCHVAVLILISNQLGSCYLISSHYLILLSYNMIFSFLLAWIVAYVVLKGKIRDVKESEWSHLSFDRGGRGRRLCRRG